MITKFSSFDALNKAWVENVPEDEVRKRINWLVSRGYKVETPNDYPPVYYREIDIAGPYKGWTYWVHHPYTTRVLMDLEGKEQERKDFFWDLRAAAGGEA